MPGTRVLYFQKYVNAVFADLMARNIVTIYMNDLIIPSIDYKEGIQYLKEILKTTSSHELKINWKKCQFLKTQVKTQLFRFYCKGWDCYELNIFQYQLIEGQYKVFWGLLAIFENLFRDMRLSRCR